MARRKNRYRSTRLVAEARCQCGKVAFRSEKDALKAAEDMLTRKGVRMDAYSHRKVWHLRSVEKRQKAKQEKAIMRKALEEWVEYPDAS